MGVAFFTEDFQLSRGTAFLGIPRTPSEHIANKKLRINMIPSFFNVKR